MCEPGRSSLAERPGVPTPAVRWGGPQGLSELALGHPEHGAAAGDERADVAVDVVGHGGGVFGGSDGAETGISGRSRGRTSCVAVRWNAERYPLSKVAVGPRRRTSGGHPLAGGTLLVRRGASSVAVDDPPLAVASERSCHPLARKGAGATGGRHCRRAKPPGLEREPPMGAREAGGGEREPPKGARETGGGEREPPGTTSLCRRTAREPPGARSDPGGFGGPHVLVHLELHPDGEGVLEDPRHEVAGSPACRRPCSPGAWGVWADSLRPRKPVSRIHS